MRPLRWLCDLAVTVLPATYFFVSYLIVFLPAVLASLVFAPDRAAAVQRIHHLFMRGFLALIRLSHPGLRYDIDAAIRDIRGAVVVCNHRSYLDPLFLIALFPRHQTIAKATVFDAPILGWLVDLAGFVPAGAGGRHAGRVLERIDRIGDHLAAGGVVFVFPEGTRRRGDGVGPFHKGAFSLARRFGAPVDLLRVRHTDQLFAPGRAILSSRGGYTLSIEHLGRLSPDYDDPAFSTRALRDEARAAYAEDRVVS